MRIQRIRLTVGLIVTCGLVAATIAWRQHDTSPFDDAVNIYRGDLTRFDAALVELNSALDADQPAAQRAFRDARLAFKRIELFVEYYAQLEARNLNAPPIFRPEDEDPETPLVPTGLQVVGATVFPALNRDEIPAAKRQVELMRSAITRLSAAGTDSMPGDAFLFDAMRHEIARVATLGIAGFDVTATGDAMNESATALEGVARALEPYRSSIARRKRTTLESLDARFAASTKYLRLHSDFEHFDRLEFIADYVQPLAHSLAEVQAVLALGAPSKARAWSAQAASIFDRDAFDPMFFAALGAPRPDSAIIDLGRALFFDTRLSPSGTRSCASCHDAHRAFTDGRARAMLIPGHSVRGGGRNTPTLINAALQPTLFDDGRAATLEDQATDVLGSAAEMGGSLAHATTVLARDTSVSARFAHAFSLSRDSAVVPQTVRYALAAYVRSLVGLDSRFDRAVRGESGALSREERDGFNLFVGKARCGTCHFAPLFNGAMPPLFAESEPEVIGVPATRAARPPVDPDSGRFHARRIELQLFAFKTPTLRNIALTAPYMHNGVFETLEQVVDFYDGGGGRGVGISIQQTLPTDSLHLNGMEKRSIIAFMRALTDTQLVRR